MSKYSDGWEDEIEWLPEDEVPAPVECFQFEKPVYEFQELEWATIRSIARECMNANMYQGDQFKIAIESYHRYLALTNCNIDLDKEIKDRDKIFH